MTPAIWRPTATFLTLYLAAVATPVAAENWPEFRGPTGQGHSSADNLPTEWSQTQNVSWKKTIPGKGWSSPVVYDGRLFLTTAVPNAGNDDGQEKDSEQNSGVGSDAAPQVLHVLCLDAKSGELLWDREVFRHGDSRIHGKNSHASPTPICDRDQVYVHFGTHGTARLDHAGKIVWKMQDLVYKPQHGNGGSPALGPEALYINCDGADRQFIAAVDRETGKVRWRTIRPTHTGNGFSFSTPLLVEVNGSTQVISPASNFVLSYDATSGREIWRVEYPGGYSVVPRPVYGHGLVYACSGFNKPSLYAIRPDGKGDVTKTHVAWQTTRGVPHTPAPLVVGDEIYFVSDKGVASCLDAKSGDSHWRERVGGNHSAAPIYADGRIYFLSEEGEATVIAAGTEFAQIAKNALEERTLASYAVADGAVFIRTLTQLYRITKGP
jgi:outer membrane protein assembly factor BamB